MKNQVTEKDIKFFMELKAPTKAIGFFSNSYSGDKESFVDGIHGDLTGAFTGLMVLLPKAEAENVFKEMTQKMEELHE
jgi:hypothetical protein